MPSPWLPEEDTTVDWRWGEEPLEQTASVVGRSVEAVRARLRSRGRATAASRGKTAIAALAERTGYSFHQIARAIRAAKLRPVRTQKGPHGWTLLTEEQCASVIKFLGEDTREATERTTVADVAELAEVSIRTAWRYVSELGIDPMFGTLEEEDALTLYVALAIASRPKPPAGSARTVRAIAKECELSRGYAYRLAAREPRLRAGRDGRLSEADAEELRRRLGGTGLAGDGGGGAP